MSGFAPPFVISRAGLFCLDRDRFRSDPSGLSLILESGGETTSDSRYCYEAVDPWLVLRASGSDLELLGDGTLTRSEGDPFSILQELIEPYNQERRSSLPPFPDVAGYIGYGASRWTMPISSLKGDPLGLPDMAIGFFDTFLIRDRIDQRTWLVSTGLPKKGAAGLSRARERMEGLRRNLVPCVEAEGDLPAAAHPCWSPEMTDGYRESIESVLEEIRDGQIYQANITRLFRMKNLRDPFSIYSDLARCNPAPYAGLLRHGQFSVLSSSPELFLRMEGGLVESSPIKGTRPRSDDRCEDTRLATELMQSEKDLAEHTMIVDLVRNDLGVNCRYGSVYVDPLYEVRSCPSVHHLSSTVCGQLEEGRGFVDVMRALFPGGSITGAPKRRSVEIIDQEEREGRGPFYGTMGFYSFDRKAVWNLLIRSAVVTKEEIAFRVGGGIVADSLAEEEWREMVWKGSRLFDTFRSAGVQGKKRGVMT